MKFRVPVFAVYQALCERLETLNHVTDATECFHDMARNLEQETNNRQAKWIAGE